MNAKRLCIVTITGLLVLNGCAKEVVEETPTPEVVTLEPVEAPAEEFTTEIPPATIEILETPVRDVERGLHPDSALVRYMIRPNDWLSKIALQEYGNPRVWRRIYAWNRETIGANPNLIYPYHELDLFKPESQVTEQIVDFIIHEVQPGENLWSIAVQEYSDGKAWSILFWDNEELLNSNSGVLKPGMRLQVRTQIWSDR